MKPPYKPRWVLQAQPAERSWWVEDRNPNTGVIEPTPRDGFTAKCEQERRRMSLGRCASAVTGLQREAL